MAGFSDLAGLLSALGRHGDTQLAHVSPREMQLLRALGGSGTQNPSTGLPEFFDTSLGLSGAPEPSAAPSGDRGLGGGMPATMSQGPTFDMTPQNTPGVAQLGPNVAGVQMGLTTPGVPDATQGDRLSGGVLPQTGMIDERSQFGMMSAIMTLMGLGLLPGMGMLAKGAMYGSGKMSGAQGLPSFGGGGLPSTGGAQLRGDNQQQATQVAQAMGLSNPNAIYLP